jgi:hypothetical protein
MKMYNVRYHMWKRCWFFSKEVCTLKYEALNTTDLLVVSKYLRAEFFEYTVAKCLT